MKRKLLSLTVLILLFTCSYFIYNYIIQKKENSYLLLNIESKQKIIEQMENKFKVEKNTDFQVIDSLQQLINHIVGKAIMVLFSNYQKNVRWSRSFKLI